MPKASTRAVPHRPKPIRTSRKSLTPILIRMRSIGQFNQSTRFHLMSPLTAIRQRHRPSKRLFNSKATRRRSRPRKAEKSGRKSWMNKLKKLRSQKMINKPYQRKNGSPKNKRNKKLQKRKRKRRKTIVKKGMAKNTLCLNNLAIEVIAKFANQIAFKKLEIQYKPCLKKNTCYVIDVITTSTSTASN